MEEQHQNLVAEIFDKKPSKLKGRKLEPKYRDPETGKTWAGRGRLPKFLQGKDKEQYKI